MTIEHNNTLCELGTSGNLGATPGSLDWAIAIRLEIQASIKQVASTGTQLRDWMHQMSEHQGYLNLHKADCSSFRSFEEFCQESKPFGLGYDIEILNRIAQERHERQRREKLEDVPESCQGARRDLPARHDVTKLDSESQHDVTKLDSESQHPAAYRRLRAIKRSPTIVRDLYENNLLGEIEASRLGLLNPSVERRQQIDEIVKELKELPLPSSAVQKRVFKRQANALVNKKLGTSYFEVIDDPAKAAKALVKKFKGERLRQLIELLQQHL